ncbi:MAG TPA: hypothetical protein VN643_02475 [Pyrinomonadaceae bacterium]|nr:hypothetical protein [Pyrinomonadaceae bacterium]
MKRESKSWHRKLWHGHPARGSFVNTQRVFSGLLLITALLVSSLSAFAQQKPAAVEQRGVVVTQQRVLQGPDDPAKPLPPDTVFFVGTEMNFDGKLVKGAPYSAQAVTESIQTLVDGNRIINKTTSTIYRDSEGRTRREHTLTAVGPFPIDGDAQQTISINDPVAGVNYSLDPRTKTAHKMMPMQFKFKIASPDGEKTPAPDSMTLRVGPEDRFEVPLEKSAAAGKLQRKEMLIEKIPAPGVALERGEISIERTPAPPGTPGDRVEAHPEVFIRHGEGMAMAGTGGMVMTWKAGAGKDAKQESLGKQVIEGVEAEGSRTIFTIPAGSVGNERAIEMINERWYSPELQVVVMTKHSDPRFGETTYRLTNINRSEQPKSLFEVPTDYTVREPQMGPAGSKMRMRKPTPDEQ